MNLKKDIKLFTKFGFYFYEYIGDKTIVEIFSWVKKTIMSENNIQGIHNYEKMYWAIINLKDNLHENMLNKILEKEFGLFADPLPVEKSYIKNFANYIGDNRRFLQEYADCVLEAVNIAKQNIGK